MAHDVFISYASEDKSTADAACTALESRGIRCWIAPRDILAGRPYGAAIVEAIRTSRVMVLIFSSRATASPQVTREVERAVHNRLTIIPFRIENVLPEGEMEFFLSSPHWLDALAPPLERHLDRLGATVAAQLQQGGPAPPPAPDPVDGADRSFAALLRRYGWLVAAGAAVLLALAVILALGRRSTTTGVQAGTQATQAPAPSSAPVSPSAGTGPLPSRGTVSPPVVTVLPSSTGQAQPPPTVVPRPPPPTVAPAPPPPAPNAPSLVISQKYGAAVRVAPSSDARIITVLGCGSPLRQVDASNGWYRTVTSDGRIDGWVGSARVAAPQSVSPSACDGAVTYQPGDQVYSHVQTGCLSLRSSPSRSASFTQCVSNGHQYTIINGPIEVDGEDWFQVTSPSTGSGWVLADFLVR